MKKLFVLVAIHLSIAAKLLEAAGEGLPPLPTPASNNAVAMVKINGQTLIYSMMGLGAQKTWNSVTNDANALNLKYGKWTAVRPVPGLGRLGAVAAAAREEILLFGGFVPTQNGMVIVPDVSIYAPAALRWYRGPDLPTGVRDAVAGVYRDRYIYVIGGMSNHGPISQVQMYDAEAQRWFAATPFPGSPVFGHAGAVVGDTILYADGAKKNPVPGAVPYIPSDECWVGKIDHRDAKKIEWNKISPHPGTGRYRIAAGSSDREAKVYFAGGSATIYDYDGIGPDGKPAELAPEVFAWNLKNQQWELIEENPSPTMDHRGLLVTSEGLVIVGGMGKGGAVVATVAVLPKRK
jgi:N-acetylneuraminic acid mutarotase